MPRRKITVSAPKMLNRSRTSSSSAPSESYTISNFAATHKAAAPYVRCSPDLQPDPVVGEPVKAVLGERHQLLRLARGHQRSVRSIRPVTACVTGKTSPAEEMAVDQLRSQRREAGAGESRGDRPRAPHLPWPFMLAYASFPLVNVAFQRWAGLVLTATHAVIRGIGVRQIRRADIQGVGPRNSWGSSRLVLVRDPRPVSLHSLICG
jgi:hypothetical protein